MDELPQHEARFVNLTLTIEPAQEGYYSLHLHSSSRTPAAAADHVASISERTPLLRHITAELLKLPVEAAESHRHQGLELYRAIFSGSLGGAFERIRQSAYALEKGLCFRLDLTLTPELDALAWEYLSDSDKEYLFLSTRNILVRTVRRPLDTLAPVAVKPPLRVLAVSPSSNNYSLTDLRAELEKFEQFTKGKQVAYDLVKSGTLEELQSRLKQTSYHVLYLAGQVRAPLPPDDARDHSLIFQSSQGGDAYAVNVERLSALLRPHHTLRLLLLNVRRYAEPQVFDRVPVASEFIRQGFPAVISLPPKLSDIPAVFFAAGLCGALSFGRSLYEAMILARTEALLLERHEPITPSLYTDSPDGVLFNFTIGDVKSAESLGSESALSATLPENSGDEAATDETPPEIRRLIAQLESSDLRERLDAIKKLVAHASPVAINLILDRLMQLGSPTASLKIRLILRREATVERIEIAKALGRMSGSQAATRALIALLKDEVPEIRRVAAEMLGRVRDPEALDALFDVLSDDEFVNRWMAVRSISRIAGKKKAPLLAELIVAQGENRSAQDTIIEALRQTRNPETKAFLEALLNRRRTDMQPAVINALRRLGAKKTVELLLELLEGTQGNVRQFAARAFADLADYDVERVRAALAEALKVSSPEVSSTARRVLSEIEKRHTQANDPPRAGAAFNGYAVVVGISAYPGNRALAFNAKEAHEVFDVLTDPAYCGYAKENVRLLIDEQATRAAILDALSEMVSRAGRDSTVLFYFSGHGTQLSSILDRESVLVPFDAFDADIATESPLLFITSYEVGRILQAKQETRPVLILDASHSGGWRTEGRIVLLASGGKNEVSPSNIQSSRPPGFTRQLIEALRGKVKSDDGFIRPYDLFVYIRESVEKEFPAQHPFFFTYEGGDVFPLALYWGGLRSPAAAAGFRYDVFVSYADQDADADLVHDEILPRLAREGLSVAVSRVVNAPGVHSSVNVNQGLVKSRRIMLVLSRSYGADQYDEIRKNLAVDDPDVRKRLLLVRLGTAPIKRAPAWLRDVRSLKINLRRESDFRAGLGELVAELKRPDNLVEEPEQIPLPLPAASPVVSHALQKIESWLSKDEPRGLFITGSPGIGKSSVVQRLAHTNQRATPDAKYPHLSAKDLTIVTYDARHAPGKSSWSEYLVQVANQLAARIPVFAEGLSRARGVEFEFNGDVNLSSRSIERKVRIRDIKLVPDAHPIRTVREAYHETLRNPLSRLHGSDFQGSILIVVDGLDEASVEDRESLMEVLRLTDRLPEYVRLICTSRVPGTWMWEAVNRDAQTINLDDAWSHVERLNRLTPTARKALLWADGLRRLMQTPSIRSEFILAGLLHNKNTSAHALLTLFEDEEVAKAELEKHLSNVFDLHPKFNLVKPTRSGQLTSLPLNDDAEAVLIAAAIEADRKERRSIRARQLLLGFLADPNNQAGEWIGQMIGVSLPVLYSLISSTPDGTPPLDAIWRASSRPYLRLGVHRTKITAIAFDHSATYLYTGDASGTVRSWDIKTCSVLHTVERTDAFNSPQSRDLSPSVVDIKLAANNERVVIAWSDDHVEGFDLKLAEKHFSFFLGNTSGEALTAMALMNEDRRAVVGTSDGRVQIWDLQESRLPDQLHVEFSQPISAVAVAPDLRHLVYATLDGRLVRYSFTTESIRQYSERIDGDITSLMLISNGRRALTGSSDGRLAVWDLGEDNPKIFFLRGHRTGVVAIAGTPDGRHIVTASSGGSLRIWNLENRSDRIIQDDMKFRAAAVSPDGFTLAAGTVEGAVLLWDLRKFLPEVSAPVQQSYRMLVSITPEEVAVGESMQLRVEVVPSPAGAGAFALPVGRSQLYCFVSADDFGLHVNSPEGVAVTIDPATGYPRPVVFELQAYLRGRRSYTVTLSAEETGSERVQVYEPWSGIVNVTSPPPDTERPSVLPAIEVHVMPPPDFVLHVASELEGDDQDPRLLTYRLTSRLPDLALREEKVGEIMLSAAQLTRLRALLEQTLRHANELQPPDARARLLSFGKYLFDLLFPHDKTTLFREAFWKAAGRLKTWLIVEDGVTWLPWELVVPHGDEDDTVPAGFLCERFRLSRWVEGLGPPLYSELPLGEIALAHYRTLDDGDPGEDPELSAWRTLIGAKGASRGISLLLRPETPFFGMHLLRYAGLDENRRDIAVRDGVSAVPADAVKEAQQVQLDLRMKRPVITLSIVDGDRRSAANFAEGWPLPDRVLPYLRAGAGAVAGPWWPTSGVADRIFWSSFYELLAHGLSLGEVVWRARLSVVRALPERADWLSYTVFGDPRARAYLPQDSEGYTLFERLGADETVQRGQPCYFRVSISRRPPLVYQDRLVRAEPLPDKPMALFLAPGLQEKMPEPIEMTPYGRSMVQATYTLTPQREGQFVVIARLFDGGERLQSLQLDLTVE
jgi:WD40 repeat protein/HEAT repeat protein